MLGTHVPDPDASCEPSPSPALWDEGMPRRCTMLDLETRVWLLHHSLYWKAAPLWMVQAEREAIYDLALETP